VAAWIGRYSQICEYPLLAARIGRYWRIRQYLRRGAAVNAARVAADPIRRYLAARGRCDPFQLYDGEPFERWLDAVGLRNTWDQCRAHAGDDATLLAAVRPAYPELVDGPNPHHDTPPHPRRPVLPDHEPGDPWSRAQAPHARRVDQHPVADDQPGLRRRPPRLRPPPRAGAHDDQRRRLHDHALAEVAAGLIAATGRDLVDVIDGLRGDTIRNQATGGRP
jgi:hypothetical protein